MCLFLYNLALLILSPLIGAYCLLRLARRGRLRAGWKERLGFWPAPVRELCRTRPTLWVHAVSVGETIAALPLLRALRERHPEMNLLLTTITETGREIALTRAREADAVLYFPVDFFFIIRRVLRLARPALVVTVDTELWPNLFLLAHQQGIPTAVANGRISDRSLRRIRRFRAAFLYRWLLPNIDRLCMQSALDAERARQLGAPPEHVLVTGSAKFDEPYPHVSPAEQDRLRAELGLNPNEPVILAGSTGYGEEPHILAAFQAVRQVYPEARLILVPRHIDRTPEIETFVRAANLSSLRRTQLPAQADVSRTERRVVIVDTLGELARLYALATVAFVGRSLVPQGGSNLLQAAAQGKPVLFGPDVSNFRDSAALLLEHGVGFQVADSAALGQQMVALLGDPARLAQIDQEARALIAANRGAVARTAEILSALIRADR